MVKSKVILLIIFLIYSPLVIVAQEWIEDITPCVDSILNTKQTKANYRSLEVKADSFIYLDVDNRNEVIFKQEQVTDWLEGVYSDSIRACEFKVDESTYYIFSSRILPASGLANNFTPWLIVDSKFKLFIEFNSLSQNPQLVYFNQEANRLNFVRVTYGDHFFQKRDWDNVDYKMELNEIDNGEVKLVIIKNSWCDMD